MAFPAYQIKICILYKKKCSSLAIYSHKIFDSVAFTKFYFPENLQYLGREICSCEESSLLSKLNLKLKVCLNKLQSLHFLKKNKGKSLRQLNLPYLLQLP